MKTLSLLLVATGSLMFYFLQTKPTRPDNHLVTGKELILTPAKHKHQYLFPVTINNKIGFIDSLGQLAIAPVYESAQEFSEGLSAVRVGGVYGFINPLGEMIINPQYDYATQFIEGRALVFQGKMPCFIDKQGTIVVGPHYMDMSAFENGRAYVVTASHKIGVINSTGKLIIDTVFQWIGPFHQGRAVAEGIGHAPDESEKSKRIIRITIIDSTGTQLVPYGRFQSIRDIGEGYYVANYPAAVDKHYRERIINHRGEVQYTFKRTEMEDSRAKVHNDIYRILRYHKGDDINSGTYDIYVSPQGKVIYENKQNDDAQDFSGNFAFWSPDYNHYTLINRHAKVIGHYGEAHAFKNGVAAVQRDGRWGVIDTTGAFIMQPTFREIHYAGIIDSFLFFKDSTYIYSNENPSAKYGMSDLRGNILIPPSFQYFDQRGFKNGLLKTWVNNRVVFYNTSGHMIWREELAREPHTHNIDHMQRGHFYVLGESTGHPGPYGAEPQRLQSPRSEESGLALTVLTDDVTVVEDGLLAMKVHISNNSIDTIIFNAQDGRLYMKVQAIDTDGAWHDIEYLPRSWCGNSYHAIPLAANFFWELTVPVYEGSLKTKLRIELKYVDPADTIGLEKRRRGSLDWYYRNRREKTIYSNEFNGSVNPGQFWRKEDYYPSGIMDSYLE